MADIVKARNVGQNGSPVCVPLYNAPFDASWDAIATYEITNRIVKDPSAGTSVLTLIDASRPEYESIDGRTVGMITQIGGNVYRDIVSVVGCTNTAFVVEIDGTEYSVRKSLVRFVVKPTITV